MNARSFIHLTLYFHVNASNSASLTSALILRVRASKLEKFLRFGMYLEVFSIPNAEEKAEFLTQ